ncbi:MAG: DUF4012 domain-containing protein [Acidimicrobiales bacterium]
MSLATPTDVLRPADGSAKRDTPARRRLRSVLLALGAVALALLLLAAVDLLRIRADIASGRRALDELNLNAAGDGGGISSVVGGAADDFRRAERRARTSPWLRIVRPLPVLGDQVDGVRDLTGAAKQVGELAESAAQEVDVALDAAAAGPAGRISLLTTVSRQIDVIEDGLDAIEVGANGFLLAPLADARRDVIDKIERGRAELEESRGYVEALRRFLIGPSRYLLLAANNAEMTAGSGMTLAAGVAVVSNGDIDVAEFRPAEDLWLGNVGGVPVPENLWELYDRMAIGIDFRGTTATPNFPVIGRLYADMSARSIAGPVDGVLVVDPVLLQAIVGVTGPVSVDGVTYNDGNVADELLNLNYLRYPTRAERDERIDAQSGVALAVFDALKQRDVDLARLAAVLRDGAAGRHLLAWSADPDLQALWIDVGAAGRLRRDGLMISVENYDGNKLDYYIRPTATLTTAPVADQSEARRVTLTVTVANERREPTSAWIEGGDPNYHFVFLDVHLPGAAFDITPLDQPFDELGHDGSMKVVTMLYPIALGETKTVSMAFTLPADVEEVTLLPGARYLPLQLSVGGRVYTDAVATSVELPSAALPLIRRGITAQPMLVLALIFGAGAAAFAASAARGQQRVAGVQQAARARFDQRAALAMGGAAVVLVLVETVRVLG